VFRLPVGGYASFSTIEPKTETTEQGKTGNYQGVETDACGEAGENRDRLPWFLSCDTRDLFWDTEESFWHSLSMKNAPSIIDVLRDFSDEKTCHHSWLL
jgi:hypothetical protein